MKWKEKHVHGNTITKSNRAAKWAEGKEGQGKKAKEVQWKPGATIVNDQHHRNNIG